MKFLILFVSIVAAVTAVALPSGELIFDRQGTPIQFLSCIIQSVENNTAASVRINFFSLNSKNTNSFPYCANFKNGLLEHSLSLYNKLSLSTQFKTGTNIYHLTFYVDTVRL